MNTKYIKMKMIEKNLSVLELSNMIKVNNNTVSRWINGKNLNQIECFLDMILILELDVSKLKE